MRPLPPSLFGWVLAVAAIGCGRSALPLAGDGPAATDGGVVDAAQADSGSEPRADAEAPADAQAEADTPDVQEPAADCGAADGLTTLASGQIRLGGLAIDQANIYWVANASADGQPNAVTVMKESLCGGAITTLATVPGRDSQSIVTDSHHVYWAAQAVGMNYMDVVPNQLFSVPVDGGAVSTLWSDPVSYFRSLAVAPTGIYGTTWSGDDGALVLVPRAVGGASGTVAADLDEPEGLTIAGTMVYWVEDYITGMYPTSGALMAMPIAGGTPVTFGQGGADPGAVVTNSTNVFWTTGGANASQIPLSALVTKPLAGGATTTLLGTAEAPLTYGPLAADDANVYVATTIPSPGTLMKVDVTGAKAPVTLGSPNVGGLAVDSTSVYWTDWYAGTVMKLTPK